MSGSEYGTMCRRLSSVQRAALSSGVTVGLRACALMLGGVEGAARSAADALGADEGMRQRALEKAGIEMFRLGEESLAGLAALPRLSVLMFLNELDRLHSAAAKAQR